MAKHKSSRLPVEEAVPGCWWGILHSLHIRERLHLRKLLGQQRGADGNHATGIKLQKAKMHLPPPGGEDYVTEDEKNIPVEDRSDPTNEDSGKAQTRAVIGREISKQKGMAKQKGKKQKVNPHATRLLRTISIHHMECDDYVRPEDMPDGDKVQENLLPSHNSGSSVGNGHTPLSPKAASEVNQGKRCEVCGLLTDAGKYFGHNQLQVLGYQLVENQVLLREKIKEMKNKLLEQQTSDGKCVTGDVALDHPKYFSETLELLKANRKLLQRTLHEESVTITNYLQEQEGSRSWRVLSKSGSFPGAGFPGRTASPFDPKSRGESGDETTLLKKKERKPKAENSPSLSAIDSTEADKSQVIVDSRQPVSNTHGVYEIASNSEWPSSFTHVMKSQKDNGTDVYRFKDIKQRIKDIIKENKEERHRISMDGVLHKIPYGCKVSQEKLSPWEAAAASKCDGNSSRNGFSSGGATPAYRRSQSLTESLDRYTYLLESNFSREPKRQISERIELVPEDSGFQATNSPKIFGRMLSLPEFDSYFLGNDHQTEVSKDLMHSSSISVDLVQENAAINVNETNEQKMSEIFGSSLGHIKGKNASPAGGVLDRSTLRNIIYAASDDSETEKIASTHLHDPEIVSHVEWSGKPAKPSPVSVLDSYLPEDLVSPAEFSVLPASSELKRGESHSEEAEPFNNPQNQSDINDSSMHATEVQSSGMQPDLDTLHVPVENAHDFHFVRDMLKKYWFDGCEQFAWDSPCHQLSSSISKEVEGLVYELEPSSGDSDISLDHGLLFDLTNEVLSEVYEASYGHYPWLSHSCRSRIRPIPVGYHFLEEVWANISWYLQSQPEANSTLESIASQDLKTNDQWMNLHHEMENVGLDLERLIFDDLLDEAIIECLDLACQQ